jgi:trehalose synthase
MYGTLSLSHRALDDLTGVAGDAAIKELRDLARPIEGLRVLNLSATGFGTGIAELLNSSVPLLVDLGLDARWQVVRASEDAAAVGRAMYQALGGICVAWTQDMTDTWLRYASMNADLLTEPFDVIIVHDPQPLAIRSFVETNTDAMWVMHSHLDLSSAQDDVWMLLRGHIENYDLAIFDAPQFVRQDLNIDTRVVFPAIDPNSARNMPLPDDVIRRVLTQYGIDPTRPLVCQISPCDVESDLVGAVDAWSAARAQRPDLQLVMVLTTEPHNPAGRACYEELARRCHNEPDAFIVAMGREPGNVEINVFQRAASVVMQKGLRKGFGLGISDALWKERPCVVAPVGGLTEQVLDGRTGLIARTSAEFTSAIGRLLSEAGLARELGENGRRHVAERFLITRYLRDYLLILNELHRPAKAT